MHAHGLRFGFSCSVPFTERPTAARAAGSGGRLGRLRLEVNAQMAPNGFSGGFYAA